MQETTLWSGAVTYDHKVLQSIVKTEHREEDTVSCRYAIVQAHGVSMPSISPSKQDK